MSNPSPTQEAAICALQGETNLNAVLPGLGDMRLARIIALDPNGDPVICAVAALSGGLPDLLSLSIASDPALRDALVWMIGMPEGRFPLQQWAQIAAAGWGRAYASALIDAVNNDRCSAGSAAALIGPCNESAALLHAPNDIAFALRRSGQATPDAPTAWMDELSRREQNRIIAIVHHDPRATSRFLPWLPSDMAVQIQMYDSTAAINAFVDASPFARARHANLVQRMVAWALPSGIGALTRLACAMKEEQVWTRVQMLIRKSPDDASRVVVAAPWDDLDATVRTTILELVSNSDICAAIAAARGHTVAERITRDSALAFFAALDPKVWDALTSDEQRRWRDALPDDAAHLAVWSLGLRPDILAKAEIGNNPVRAAARHARDDGALRWALFPVALHNIPPDMAHALIAALPTPPPDPGAFFTIASKRGVLDGRASTRTAPLPPDDLACAVALQRSVDRHATIRARCEGLRAALRGRRWNDLAPILALLDADVRAALMPDVDALTARLAHSDRKDALRQALARLAILPPEVAVPTVVALHRWITEDATAQDRDPNRDAAEAIAHVLHASGDVFLALTDACGDHRLGAALLPLPNDAALANALRNLARDDPPTAQRMCHALRGRAWRDVQYALVRTAPSHAAAVWQALPEDMRRVTVDDSIARSPTTIPRLICDPIATLALAALLSDDDDLRNAGIDALTARLDVLRALWDALPQEMQQSLRTHSFIAVSVADIPAPSPSPSAYRVRVR